MTQEKWPCVKRAQICLSCSIHYRQFICCSGGESFCKGPARQGGSVLHTNDSRLFPPHSLVILHSSHVLMLSRCGGDGALYEAMQHGLLCYSMCEAPTCVWNWILYCYADRITSKPVWSCLFFQQVHHTTPQYLDSAEKWHDRGWWLWKPPGTAIFPPV